MQNRFSVPQVTRDPFVSWPTNRRYAFLTQTPFTFGGSAFAPTRDSMYLSMVWLTESINLVGLHTRCIGSAASGAVFRLGIYSPRIDGDPGQLLLDAGTVDCATTGFKSITGLSLFMPAGLYWAAFVMQGAATGPTTYAFAGEPMRRSTNVSTFQHDQRHFYIASSVTGALPSSWSGTNPDTGLSCPHLVLERSV